MPAIGVELITETVVGVEIGLIHVRAVLGVGVKASESTGELEGIVCINGAQPMNEEKTRDRIIHQTRETLIWDITTSTF